MKASIPFLHENSNELYDFQHFAAFSADSVHLKKPSRWPKALIGSPCHGVVQEAIVNAFVHRDYHSLDPVRVTLFNDRLEVTSPGGPNTPFDAGQIREGIVHTSWRNPSLAWFMVELKYAQNEGKGIQTIMEQTKKIAGKEPAFFINSHWFSVEIPAFIPLMDSFQEKKEKVVVDFDIKSELSVLRSHFDDLREALQDADMKLKTGLDKVEESLNTVTGESPKEKFNKPLNELRRFLKKFADKDSSFHKIIISSKKRNGYR